MSRVWEKAKKLEAKGVPLSPEVFGLLIKEEWKAIKQEASRLCPIVSPEEIRRMLAELETSTSSSTASRQDRTVEVGVSVKAQQE